MQKKPSKPQEKTPAPQSDPPVNVAIPNTSALKMRAIVSLSEAVRALAQTLDGVNTKVSIMNNCISNSDTAIHVTNGTDVGCID